MTPMEKLRNAIRHVRSSPRHGLLFLLALSFLVRVLVVLPLGDFQPKFDERAYYKQAAGYLQLFHSALHGEAPARKDVRNAYNRGGFLPFNSILLALGFLLFSKKVLVARFIIILISTLTTMMVFLVTAKLFHFQAAFYAGLAHVFYPSFVSFAHLLWSETAFIFFLLVALYICLAMMGSRAGKRLLVLSLALGFFLGILALTRGSALSFLVFFPIWFAFIVKRKWFKILVPLTILSTVAITVLPWEYVLYRMEGKFVLLSTIGNQFFLYKYNNSHVRDGVMYASRQDLAAAKRTLKKYSLTQKIPPSKAAMSLFLKEITSHFPAFVKRIFENFLQMWTFDFFPLRHILNLAYPPLPALLIGFISLFFMLAPIGLVFLAIIGFFSRGLGWQIKLLLFSLIVVGMLPYLISLSHTRYNLPQIALLLPVAGYGAAKLRQAKRAWALLPVVGFALIAVYVHTYNNYIYKELRPSSYYRGIRDYSGKLLQRLEFKDQLILKPLGDFGGDRLVLTIAAGEPYRFWGVGDGRGMRLPLRHAPVVVRIISDNPKLPLCLAIHSLAADSTVLVSPIAREAWQREREIFPGKLEIIWTGGM
jgi:4-amino-4-deoxy-L-arabinose transferase-like glycosyltransferase